MSSPQAEPTSDRSLDRALAGGVKWNAIGKVIGQTASWLSTVYVARVLSPDDFGVVTMATVVVTLLAMFAEFGIGSAVVRHRELDEAQLGQLHSLAVLLGLLSALVLVALAWPAGWFFHSAQVPLVVCLLSLTLVLTAWRTVPMAVMQRELQFKQSSLFELIQSVCIAALSAVLAYLGFGFLTLVGSQIAGGALQTGLVLRKRPIRFMRPQYDRLRSLIGFSRDMLVSRFSWYLFLDSDFFVAGRQLGKSAVGAYSFAWTLSSVPVEKIASTIGGVMMPIFSAVQHDRRSLREYLCVASEALALLVMPACVGLALCAHELIGVGLGPKWTSAVVPLQILASYSAIRALLPLLSHAVIVVGDTRFVALNSVVTAVVMPIAFFIGSRWGIVGVALGWAIVHPFVGAIPLVHRAMQRIDFPLSDYLRALRPAIVGTIVMCLSVALVSRSVGQHGDRVILALKILTGVLSYTATVLLIFRDRVSAVSQRFRS